MFSKEDDISLGRTCKMVPKWGRGSRDPEKRKIINKKLCGGAVRYEQEGPLAATNANAAAGKEESGLGAWLITSFSC